MLKGYTSFIILVVVFCSCKEEGVNPTGGEAAQNTPVGTWCATRIDGSIDSQGNPLVVTCEVSKFIFNSDGTFLWYLYAMPYYNETKGGTYTYENGKITFSVDFSELIEGGAISCRDGQTSFTFHDDEGARWDYKLRE